MLLLWSTGCATVPLLTRHLLLPDIWPSKEWSHGGALSLKTLGEYVDALHVDFLHYSKEKDSYPVPQVDSMIRKRWEMQNAIAYMVERGECRDQLCLGAAVC